MPADDPLAADRLATWERSLVVLAVTHHGEAAPDLLGRLHPPAGARCVAAAAALLALPATERATTLAREAARLFAPVPAGLGRLDPTWIEAALAPLPPAARAALRATLPAAAAGAAHAAAPGAAPRPDALAWLARVALGSCCAMPPEEEGPAATPAATARRPAAAVLAAVVAAGRERVALALRHAPRSARAAFCSRLPPDEATALLRAIEAAPADAAAARRAQGQLTEVAAHAPSEVDGAGLIRRLGARALGAAVAGAGDVPRQLAQLLPRDLGLLLLEAAAGAASLPTPGERLH
jgi:hypothetical protein